MESELKRLGKNTLVYSVGNLSVKIVAFLLIPLYTHYLPIFDVGIIVLFELLELFYNSVATFGILNAMWRYFPVAQKEGEEKRYLSSNYFFILGSNLLILVALLLTAHLIAEYFLSAPDLTSLVQLFLVALFFGLNRLFLLSLLRIYEKAVQFVILVFVDSLALISLTIWFVAGLEMALKGVIYAKLITSGVMFLVTLIYLATKIGFHYVQQKVTRSLRYGFPLVFSGLGLLILTMSDRYFIKELISVEASGIYGIAHKFGMIMNMVLVTPFVQAWQPILFQLEDQANQRQIYQRTALHFVQVGVFVWLAIAVLSKYLVEMTTTGEYASGIVIIPWIAFSYLVYGLQNVFKAGALLHNKTTQLTFCTLIASGINIVLNILMIRQLGALGAAIATALSYLVMLVLVLVLSQRYLMVNWRWKKMMLITLLGIGTYLLSLRDFGISLVDVPKDLCIVILFPLLMISLELVSYSELKRFFSTLKPQ